MERNTTSPTTVRDRIYRHGIGIVLVGMGGKIFAGQRQNNQGADDYKNRSWQMPQGGVQPRETEEEAFLREMYEEIGLTNEDINDIKKSECHFYYEVPMELSRKIWGGRFIGQKQRWFMANLQADESKINLNLHEKPEFKCYEWRNPQEIIDSTAFFKVKLYQDIFGHFNLI